MNADGTGIHQISYNPSHDIDVSLLGKRTHHVGARWDNTPGRTGGSAIHLYSSNPTVPTCSCSTVPRATNTMQQQSRRCRHLPQGEECTVQFRQHAAACQNGNVLAVLRPITGADFGGNLQIINVGDNVEDNQSVPDLGYPTTTFAQQPTIRTMWLTATSAVMPVPSPVGASTRPFHSGTGTTAYW